MTTLFAQPYDLAATGFYFENADDYASKARDLRNSYGQQVEEFELQFIDGELVDAQLFEALHVSQANFAQYLAALDAWSDDEKVKAFIVVGEVGYKFELGRDEPEEFDIDLYEVDSLRDLAMQFVDEGLFGEIPKAIVNYLDYDAIARDLAIDYGTTVVGGVRYAYRSG